MPALMAYLPLILLLSAALSSGATALCVVITLRSSREHRCTIFPIVREVEGIKARRARITALVFFILAGLTAGAWVATQRNPENVLVASAASVEPVRPQLLRPALPIANETKPSSTVEMAMAKAESSVPSIVETSPTALNLAEVVANNPEPPPDPPAVILAASTPVPVTVVGLPAISTPVPVSPSQLVGAAAAIETQEENTTLISSPGNVSIGPIAFATDITDHREAVDPADIFDPRTEKIYAIFPYEGMKNGLRLSVIWYYQEKEFLRDEYQWRWGSKDRSYAFVRPPGSGNYKVEIKIGPETLATGEFTVRP